MEIQSLINGLSTQGFFIWDDFLTQQQITRIKDAIPDKLQDARIGRKDSLQGNKTVRGDQTIWLDPEMGNAIAEYMAKMEEIRIALNTTCYLGLRDFETHFCRYPSGAFYKKHSDNAKGQNRRKITTVLYMNEAWKPGDGGELIVYNAEEAEILRVDPLAGRIIFFMSEEFPHEVLPTEVTRESIAGWYLTQSQV